ncbi:MULTISPECIES: RidA family protein [unclassified Minwuia]|jgi:enamine deaminase RidA (YjgF/YER057c/UK114 family)|uniref:RidA family protein n=1 Tax=unclassified Minwuia TaxID=2618799 RepID=UPI002478EDD8|nr:MULTISPECIES: RidA family protein [unclassified Minwuia]
MQLINPPEWKRPKGYSNGVVARGSMVFVAGQIGWTGDEVFETDDFAGQARQAFANTLRVLQEAGAGPEHIVRMTWFITSKREYLDAARDVGQAFRDCFGKNFPAMAVMEVTALMEDRAKIEIETTAVIPD